MPREIKWAQEYYIWSTCHLSKQAEDRHLQTNNNLGNKEYMMPSWKGKQKQNKNLRWNQTNQEMNENAGVKELKQRSTSDKQ